MNVMHVMTRSVQCGRINFDMDVSAAFAQKQILDPQMCGAEEAHMQSCLASR
jgi:hypothetical protein